ncbi:MAG: RNA polymerase sigma factor [Ardenticatenaceae bacterium]
MASNVTFRPARLSYLPNTPSSGTLGAGHHIRARDSYVIEERPCSDPAALVAALFEEYRTPIAAYLYSLLDDWELAHDLAQQTFLSALRAQEQLAQVENRRAWLYRVASNLAFNALKRRRRFTWLPWRKADSIMKSQGDPSDEIVEVIAIERALAELPPHYRAPLLLFSYYGLSTREVAEVLDLSEGATRVRLHRARRMFRQVYTG